MQHWIEIFPDSFLAVSFEELLKSPKTQVTKALDFLQLPWNDKCLQDISQKDKFHFEEGFAQHYLSNVSDIN